jgi:DNA-binding PadR family transcriptional regulator
MLAQTISTAGVEAMVRRYRERRDVCGYDIIATVCVDFQVLLSPGQVYPVIDAMEASGVITKEKSRRRVSLRLTPLGRILLKAWKEEIGLMQLRLSNDNRLVDCDR